MMAAELSRLLSVDVSEMSAIWPPLGIAIGAVLVIGFRAVVIYAVVLAVWLVWRGHSTQVIALILVEQSLQAALAGVLLRSRLSNAATNSASALVEVVSGGKRDIRRMFALWVGFEMEEGKK